MTSTSTRALFQGTLWLGLGEVVAVVATGVAGLIAARLLSARDFGLVGIALLVSSALELTTQSGFERALTQRRVSLEPLIDVAWTWHVVRGSLLSVLLALSARPLARTYAEPLLEPIALALSPGPLLRGLQNLAVVALARELDYERQFRLRVLVAAGGAVATVIAVLLLRNVWALCVRSLASAVLAVVASFAIVPRRPRFAWDWRQLRELFQYGRWVTGSAVLVFLITQGDDLFVSKYLGLVALGYYQLAFRLASAPATHFAALVARVAFPVFARLEGTPVELERAFRGVLQVVSFVTAAAMAAVAVTADPLVLHIFGSRWQPAAPLVSALAALGFLRAVGTIGVTLFQAIGRPELEFRLNWPRLLLTLVTIWPLAARYGALGVCASVVLALVPSVLMLAYALRSELGWRGRELLGVLGAPLFGAVLLAGTLGVALRVFPATLGGFALVLVLGVGVWLALLLLCARLVRWDGRLGLVRLLALLRNPS